LEAAVERFGLGKMVAPALPVEEAWSNDVFRVRTGSGVYAVKLYPVEWSTGQPNTLREAMAFECTVLKQGKVLMPQPVTVDSAWLIDIVIESGTRAARCHDWIDGTPATREALTPDLIRAAGRSLGALHALHMPGGDSSQLSSPDMDRWDRAVRGASGQRFSWAGEFAALTPILRSLATDLELLRSERRPMRISHRDFDPKNAVVDAAGRLVVTDWDNAGPVSAEAELVIAATSFATTDEGLRQPDIERVVIKNDVANEASGRVAAKAGFVRIGEEEVEAKAAAETGVHVLWERRP